MTGTPFVNRPTDIGTLLTFLEVQPLGDPEVFDAKVTGPIKLRKEVGLGVLRTTVAHIALRRSKALLKDTLNIPSKTVKLVRVYVPDGLHKDTHLLRFLIQLVLVSLPCFASASRVENLSCLWFAGACLSGGNSSDFVAQVTIGVNDYATTTGYDEPLGGQDLTNFEANFAMGRYWDLTGRRPH